jgi:probable DNA repair protein
VNLNAAYEALSNITARTVFHAKTPDAPIQILGTLEAAGLTFDYLWIAGVDDLTWPAKPKPHAFIPKVLQREKNMPHATFEREMSYSQSLLSQFQKTADHIILSHHSKQGEMVVEASPLIAHYPLVTLHSLPQDTTLLPAEKIFASRHIETIADHHVHLPLSQGAQTGGVRLIEDQAKCPFKAFATWRLHVRELKKPTLGLGKAERGTVIHQLFALLWQQLKTQATLQGLSALARHELIQENIDQAFERVIHDHHLLSKQKRYLELEKKRCYRIAERALQHDQARSPFEVLACETPIEMQLGPLKLKGRIDRLDRVDNKKIIIDYKTGKRVNPTAWFETRIEEPQLPLYALHDAEAVDGIAFYQVTPTATLYRGIAGEEMGITGVDTLTTWPQQKETWQHTLEQLAQDFHQGIATVDPKDPEETCQYCEFKPLCRIKEDICQ